MRVRFIWAALLLFLACSCAWGACTLSYENYTRGWCNSGCNLPTTACEDSGILNACGTGKGYAKFLRNSCCGYGSTCAYYDVYCCATQAEADSAYCALNPTAEGCEQEQDTTLYYCKQEYSTTAQTWKAYIFKCSCKQQGGMITGCNGKQNVDVVEDCTPYKALNGDCAQNGYSSGANGARDSTGKDVQCFAAIGSDCIMRDKASGNTFTCAGCDGSCDYAMRKIADGSCTNPYPPPPETGDTLEIPPSGGETPPPWSSSGSSEPPPSYGEDLSALNGIYGVLDTIRDTLNGVAGNVRDIRANTQLANNYLSEIAAKDFSPQVNVNVAAPDVNVQGDTNIINVNVQGDTARAPAAILDLLSGALQGGQPQQGDTAGMGAREAGLLASIDSALADSVPNMTDSIPNAVQGVQGTFAAFKDSMANSAWNDSVSKWEGQLLDNGVLTGAGSDNCPSVLTRTWDVTLWNNVQLSFGPLGKYLCAAVPAVGVTFWALCRVIIRAVVSIACMVWIFKAVMGIDGGSSEED